jgi:hypothetical protein
MKWLMFLAVLCFSLHPSVAQVPSQTHIGLFVDDSHTTWCAFGAPVYEVELWIWVQPGAAGFLGAEFDLPFPAAIDEYAGVRAPGLRNVTTTCRVDCPWGFIFVDCQTSWVWLYHETLIVSSPDPMTIKPEHHPTGENYVAVWNCNNEEEQGVILSNLYINSCEALPTFEATWGAIKNLYGE